MSRWNKWCPKGCGKSVKSTGEKFDNYKFIYECERCGTIYRKEELE